MQMKYSDFARLHINHLKAAKTVAETAQNQQDACCSRLLKTKEKQQKSRRKRAVRS
ncbi:MAG: hypothetical protein CM15mV89_0250 [Caudoviricetes sp.]|nr:MAG: hypothetical protein CM15mV89_0250 [Caudoviricetes sp.]